MRQRTEISSYDVINTMEVSGRKLVNIRGEFDDSGMVIDICGRGLGIGGAGIPTGKVFVNVRWRVRVIPTRFTQLVRWYHLMEKCGES